MAVREVAFDDQLLVQAVAEELGEEEEGGREREKGKGRREEEEEEEADDLSDIGEVIAGEEGALAAAQRRRRQQLAAGPGGAAPLQPAGRGGEKEVYVFASSRHLSTRFILQCVERNAAAKRRAAALIAAEQLGIPSLAAPAEQRTADGAPRQFDEETLLLSFRLSQAYKLLARALMIQKRYQEARRAFVKSRTLLTMDENWFVFHVLFCFKCLLVKQLLDGYTWIYLSLSLLFAAIGLCSRL